MAMVPRTPDGISRSVWGFQVGPGHRIPAVISGSEGACEAGPLLWEANALSVARSSWNCCSDSRRESSWKSQRLA